MRRIQRGGLSCTPTCLCYIATKRDAYDKIVQGRPLNYLRIDCSAPSGLYPGSYGGSSEAKCRRYVTIQSLDHTSVKREGKGLSGDRPWVRKNQRQPHWACQACSFTATASKMYPITFSSAMIWLWLVPFTCTKEENGITSFNSIPLAKGTVLSCSS